MAPLVLRKGVRTLGLGLLLPALGFFSRQVLSAGEFPQGAGGVKFKTIEEEGRCEKCGRIKPDVEKIKIAWIIRQQDWQDGEDIDPKSPLGKRITRWVKLDTIYEEWCQSCRDKELDEMIPL